MKLQRITSVIVLFCSVLAIIGATVFFGAVHIWAASGIHLLALILFLISALTLTSRFSVVRFEIADFCFLAIAGIVLFGYFRSPHEFLSRQELLSVIACIGFYLAVRIHLYRSWHFQTLCFVLFFLTVGISFYAIYQHFSESTRILWREQYLSYFGRVSGTYICPNHFAGLVILTFPIALSLLIWCPLHPIARVILAYGLAVMLLGIFFSYSRGGLLSLGFAVTITLFFGMRSKLKAVVAIVSILLLIAAAALLILNLSNPEQWHRFLDGMEKGESTRPQMWRSAWQIFLDHPYFGVGPMMFDAWHAHYRGMLLNRATYAHNDYLQLLADYGILGGIAVVVLVISIFVQLRRGSIKFKIFESEYQSGSRRFLFQRALFIGVIGSWAGVSAHLMVDFDMHILANALIMSILLASAISASTSSEDVSEIVHYSHSGIVRWILVTIFLAAPILLGSLIYRNFLGDYWRMQAREADLQLEWQLAEKHFEKAISIDSKNSKAWEEYMDLLYRRAKLGILQRAKWVSKFLDTYDKALASDPFNYHLRIRRGEVLDLVERYEEAEKEYQSAIDFDPNNPFYYSRFGLHYQRRGMNEKASECFSRSLQLNGSDQVSQENLKELRPM